MGLVETVAVVIVAGVPMVFVLLLVWGMALGNLRETEPPAPHDPSQLFALRSGRWAAGPNTLADHGFGDRLTADGDTDRVDVAELVSITGGGSRHEDNSVEAVSTIRLADGEQVVHRGPLEAQHFVRPGMWIPYHPANDLYPSQFHPAWDLDREQLREVLITHRLQLGLVDVVDAAELVVGEPSVVTVGAVRATGLIRHGHVEVELTLDDDAVRDVVTTLLRPEEIATARHSRQIPVIRTYDRRWVVWPTWY